VDNVVTSGHQAGIVALNYSKRKISKEIKLTLKGNEWDRKQYHL
jgi:hypothetical protein